MHPLGEVVKQRTNALDDAFRRNGLPVVLVVATGGSPGRTEQARSHRELPADAADLLPELKRQPQDYRVTKLTRGVTQVVLVGVATSNGVESTARHVYELGFNVTLAIDAMTDGSPESHDCGIKRIFPKLGETGTTQEIIDLLDKTRR